MANLLNEDFAEFSKIRKPRFFENFMEFSKWAAPRPKTVAVRDILASLVGVARR